MEEEEKDDNNNDKVNKDDKVDKDNKVDITAQWPQQWWHGEITEIWTIELQITQLLTLVYYRGVGDYL